MDLCYCDKLDNQSLALIEEKCPQLKTLNLAGCRALTEVKGSYWAPSRVSPLTHLDISHCGNLNVLQLKALSLETLLAKHNPQLIQGELITSCAGTDFAHSPQVKLSHKREGFGKKMWEEYFGDIGRAPPSSRYPQNIK